MKQFTVFAFILLGLIIWPLTINAGQNRAASITPTLPCYTPTPTPTGSLPPTGTATATFTPGPFSNPNELITPTPSTTATSPPCMPTFPPICVPIPTPSPTPTPLPTATPCVTVTPGTTPLPTLIPCSIVFCVSRTPTPGALTPTPTPCFNTPTSVPPTPTPWATPTPTSTNVSPTPTDIPCINTPTPWWTPTPGTLTPTATTSVFTATVGVIPHTPLLTIGDPLTVTVTLDVSEGCVLPVFELTLSQTANKPPFAPAEPIILGPGVSMPATITLTAVTTGTTTFHALVFGERNCNNTGWIWTYVHGDSVSVMVIDTVPRHLYLPMTHRD